MNQEVEEFSGAKERRKNSLIFIPIQLNGEMKENEM
jgi:hypothetical protein